MGWDKDIRFPEKRVDASWKDDVNTKKGLSSANPLEAGKRDKSPEPSTAPLPPRSQSTPTSKPFMNLVSSLGYQALMHLGEIPNPATRQPEQNLQAAQEIIELLQSVKEKTQGNLSPEENELLLSLLSELQMKFSSHV